MKMLIARENTGHARNLFSDAQYLFVHFNSYTQLDWLFYPTLTTVLPQIKTFSRAQCCGLDIITKQKVLCIY